MCLYGGDKPPYRLVLLLDSNGDHLTDNIGCNTCGHVVGKQIRETVNFLTSRLCLDCNKIYDSPPEVCPFCSSEQSLSVPTYFGRTTAKIELQKAKYCSDCKYVSEGGDVCSTCGSNKIFDLRSVLDQSKISDKLRGIERKTIMSISKVFKIETAADVNIEVYNNENNLVLGFLVGDQPFDVSLNTEEIKDLQKVIRLVARSLKVKND